MSWAKSADVVTERRRDAALVTQTNGRAPLRSPKQVVVDLLPCDHTVLGLLRREEMRAERTFVRLERRRQRGHRGVRRQILGRAEDVLALRRDDEIDEQLGR